MTQFASRAEEFRVTFMRMQQQINNLQSINDELLTALKLIASLPDFEQSKPYAETVLSAIARAKGQPKIVSAGVRPYPE